MFESITDGIAQLWGGGESQKPASAAPPDAAPSAPPVAPAGPPPPPEAYAFLGDMYGGPANQNAKPVDTAAAGRAANELFKAMDGIGTNDKAVFKALEGKSPAEIAAIKEEYKKRTDGRSLDADLEDEMSGDTLKHARALVANDQHGAALEALKDAKGLISDTDPQKVKEALAGIKDPAERKKLLEEAGITEGAESAKGIAGTAAKYALIGSVVPGVGTVVGGLVGGIVGALEGSSEADQNTKIIEAIAEGKDDKAAGEIIKNELHGGLFGHGGLLGIGIGRDQSKIESAIETAKDPGAVAAAYQAATGKSLAGDVADHLDGDDKDVAVALMHGNKADAAAARIHRAKDGVGTKEGDIYKQLEGKSDAERKAIVDSYNRMHAKSEGMDFDGMLKDELSDNDLEKARELEAHGKLDPAFAMKMAMDGAGTDAQLMKDTLKGKSKEEIAAIEADYNERYKPRTFRDDMAGELKISGREGFEIEEALKGDPDTIKDPQARMKAKLEAADRAYDFERGSGAGFLDKGVRALSGTFGDGTTRSVTDLFSDSGELMDKHHAELAAIGEKMKSGQPLTPEQAKRMASLVEYQRDDVDNFRAAKDTVTDTAAAAGTAVAAAVAAVVVEVVTAGAATPAVVGAISALVGGLGGMGIKAGLQGSGYGNDQIATDAAMTIVDAISAGAVQSGPFLKALQGMPGGGAILANKILLEAIKNGASGTASALARGLLDQNTYREEGGAWNLAKSVALAGAGAAASGALAGKMNVVTAGQSRALAGLLGGMAGGALQTAIDPAAWDEGGGKILVRNMAINAVSSMITSRAGHSEEHEVHPGMKDDGPAPTQKSPVSPTVADGHPPVEVVPAKPLSGPPTEYPPVHPDVPKDQWAWGRYVPENPGLLPESGPPSEPATRSRPPAPPSTQDPATMPRADLPKDQWAWGHAVPDNPGMRPESIPAHPTQASPGGGAPAGHAPAVDVVEPKTLNGPPTEYPPVHADVPREQWAWGPVVPEHPDMWPASAAPSSDPLTQPKRAPVSQPDPATMPRADLPKDQWAWGHAVPDNPGMWPESAPRPPTQASPGGGAPAGHAPAVDVVDPKTLNGPPTEYPPVHADVPREQWAWGPVVPEHPDMWPASAAPSSDPLTQPKRAPVSEPDPATMPRADLPKSQWAWGDVVPDNPGMWPESLPAPSSGSAPTLDKPTLVKPGQPQPGADAPATVRKGAPDPLDYHVEPGKFNEPEASPEALKALDEFAARWRAENGVPNASDVDPAPVTEDPKTLPRPRPEEPRPFEDMFQERLEGEGRSRDPDPDGVVAKLLAPADPEKTGEIAGRAEQLARARAGEKVRIVTPEPAARPAAPPAPMPELPEIPPEQLAAWEQRNAEAYARALAARQEYERSPLLDVLSDQNGDPQRVAAVKDLIKQGASPEEIRRYLEEGAEAQTMRRP